MESDKIDEQTGDNSVFDWFPISSAVCRLGSDKILDYCMSFDYPGKNFHYGYYELELIFSIALKIE